MRPPLARGPSKPEYRLSDIPLQGMPIQADGVEKPEFVRTQAADFRRLLGVTIHQFFKSSVPTKNFPKSNKLRVREWLRKDIRHLEIGHAY